MRATFATFLFASAALAQQNAFNVPTGGYSGVTAGQPLNLSWKPSAGNSVTLILRSGDSDNLQEGTEITSNAPNSGSFTWNVPADLTKGFTYTVQIVADNGDINYTPYFAIDSTNTQPSQTAIVATGAPTGSGAQLPPVPQSLAAQQSSATSAARTAATDSSMSMTMAGAGASATSAASSATMSAAGATSASSSATMSAASAGSSAASSSSAAGVGAVKVSGGLLAALAGFVAWVL